VIGRFKTLFVVLALLALPLRGMATVAMWHCAQDQRDASTVSAGQHTLTHAAHGQAASGHSDHRHDEPAQNGSPEGPMTPSASACSACAACCIGASIAPTGWSSFSFAPIGASRIAFVEQHFTGVVPAQLERPPLVQSL